MCPRVNDRSGNLKWLVFMEKRKPKYREKTSRNNGEQTTNSTHIWRPRQDVIKKKILYY